MAGQDKDVDNTEEIKVLSLCAGYGGLEIGLAGALQTILRVVAVEIEAFALANLVTKAEEGKLAIEALWPDLRTFPAERFRECFDIITAGYPCQPFSVAGKRQGADDPRHLWPHIERIIEAVRPVWFFGENVSGHLTLGFPTVYRSLRNLGYTVEAGLFTAAECGAPHRRERLFILANNGKGNTRKGGLCPQRGLRGIEKRREAKSTGIVGGQSNGRGRKELADTATAGLHKGNIGQEGQIARNSQERWPARPGQPQYEWEEPRVVANPKQRCRRGQNGDTQQLQCKIQTARPNKGQIKSRLGRTIDGTSYILDESTMRVDRLRLLGNGVVPQQAEKAFRYLIRKFE